MTKDSCEALKPSRQKIPGKDFRRLLLIRTSSAQSRWTVRLSEKLHKPWRKILRTIALCTKGGMVSLVLACLEYAATNTGNGTANGKVAELSDKSKSLISQCRMRHRKIHTSIKGLNLASTLWKWDTICISKCGTQSLCSREIPSFDLSYQIFQPSQGPFYLHY